MTMRAACIRRPATVADYDYLYDLHVATMRDYVGRTWGWDGAVQERMFREQFDPKHVEIVERDGQRIGVLSVEDRGDEVFLRSIEVDPAHQGLSIGTAMVVQLIRSAATTGRPVSLQVLKVNPALRLYQRLGFALIEETATHFRMRFSPRTRSPRRRESSRARMVARRRARRQSDIAPGPEPPALTLKLRWCGFHRRPLSIAPCRCDADGRALHLGAERSKTPKHRCLLARHDSLARASSRTARVPPRARAAGRVTAIPASALMSRGYFQRGRRDSNPQLVPGAALA